MIEELIEALQDCLDAKARHDKARARGGEGYDWSYFGADYIAYMEAAQKNFREALNNLIDSRVTEVLDKRSKEGSKISHGTND